MRLESFGYFMIEVVTFDKMLSNCKIKKNGQLGWRQNSYSWLEGIERVKIHCLILFLGRRVESGGLVDVLKEKYQ